LIALASGCLDPFANLALEESLLEGSRLPRRAIFLYVDGPCVVVGRNQNPWIEASPSACVPVLRRISGGGAVYHDEGNLNWSLIVPRDEHDREAELAFVASALASLGLRVEADERGALRFAGQGPFSGAKVSGTARRILRDRVLHHGTLLVAADLERMSACLGGATVARSAAPSSVPSRVANLAQAAPGLRVDDVASALARAASGREAESAWGLADGLALERAERRLRSWEWTWGATPPFSIEVGGRASIEVRGGIVTSASGPGADALAGLVGSRFDYGLPAVAEALTG